MVSLLECVEVQQPLEVDTHLDENTKEHLGSWGCMRKGLMAEILAERIHLIARDREILRVETFDEGPGESVVEEEVLFVIFLVAVQVCSL